MMDQPASETSIPSDSLRDAIRYRSLVSELCNIAEQLRQHSDVLLTTDTALAHLLSRLCLSLNGEKAFLAEVKFDRSNQDPVIEVTAAYPDAASVNQCLPWSPLFIKLRDKQRCVLVDRILDEKQSLINGLEIFSATTAVIVRIEIGGKMRFIGVCNRDKTLGPFLASDKMILQSLTDLFTFGIEIGERRHQELEQLQKTSLSINAELVLDELLSEIAQRAEQVFKSPVSLMLWDETQTKLVVQSLSGLSDHYKSQIITRERFEVGLATMRNGASIITADLKTAAYGDQELLKYEGLCSVLTAILKVGSNILGILNIYSRSIEKTFDQHDRELAEIFASQAAMAIRNASLRKRVADDGKKAASLVRNAVNLELLAEFLVKEVSEVLLANAAGLILESNESHSLQFAHTMGLSAEFKHSWRITPAQVRALTFRDGRYQPTIIPDLSAELFGSAELTRQENLYSALVAPLVSDEKIFGMLIIYSKGTHRRFDLVDLELTQIFINQAVQAIDTAQAFQEVRDARDELKRLLDTVSAVAYASSLKDGLSALSRYLVDWLKVTFCHIFTYNQEEQILTMEAFHPVNRSHPLEWKPENHLEINLKSNPDMRKLVNLANATVFIRKSKVGELNVLEHLEQVLGLKGSLVQALVFPLTKDEKVLGICTLGEMRARPESSFDVEKINKAVRLASQAIPLILQRKMQDVRDLRSYQEVQLRKAVERITQNLSLAPADLTSLIAEMACNILSADCAVVYPYYDQLGVYDVHAVGTYGLEHPKSSYSSKSRYDHDGITNQILLRQSRMVVDDVHTGRSRDNPYLIDLDKNKFIKRENVYSFVGLRLQIDQEPLGALFVNFRKPHRFFESELDVIGIFASQAAVAIHQARLLQRGAKEHAAIEAMYQITKMIGVNTLPNPILLKILRNAFTITGKIRHGMVLQTLPEEASFRIITQLGYINVPKDGVRHSQLFLNIVRENKARLVLDTREDRLSQENGYRDEPYHRIRSVLAAPFSSIGKGDPDSILILESTTPAKFTPDDRDVLEDLAAFAGIALQSTTNFQQIRANSRLQVNLLKASQSISELKVPEKILQTIVNSTKTALKCDLVTLHTYNNETEQLNPGPFTAGELFHENILKLNPSTVNRTIAAKIIITGRPHFSNNAETDPKLAASKFVVNERIKSSGGMPLIMGGERLGILYVNYRQPHKFSTQEKRTIMLFARQATLAIRNAHMYEQLQTKNFHLQKVHNASKLIVERISAGRDQLLTGVLKEAVETVTGAVGGKATIGTIQIRRGNALIFESYYPKEQPPEVLAYLCEPLPLDPAKTADGRVGITVRAFLDKKPILTSHVQDHPDYRVFRKETKSELAVPLMDNDQVIGVLNVESDQENNFDEDDRDGLIALADLTVIALHNAERTEQLTRANAVAIMGAWGADVVHDINREVGNIRLAVKLLSLRKDLNKEVRDKINSIDASTEEIRQPNLGEQTDKNSHDGIPQEADQIIRDAVAMLQDRNNSIDIHFFGACPGQQVGMDGRWITRVIRHLVVNAARETKGMPGRQERPQITIRTCLREDEVEVQVEDDGPGVSADIVGRLFKEPLPNKGQSGRGLLLVQFLVEHHGGKINLAWNRPGKGACFSFTLAKWQA
jgi:GAF domain-containing protein